MVDPLISVVLPVYNGERFLTSALRSILDQGYSNLEIIVVDDGSTDRSAELSRSFDGVKYFHQSKRGAAAARNLGIGNARGGWLAFLDHDDLWLPGRIRAQIRCIQDQPGLELVVGNTQVIDERGKILSQPFLVLGFGCALIRRDLFEKIGLLDEN